MMTTAVHSGTSAYARDDALGSVTSHALALLTALVVGGAWVVLALVLNLTLCGWWGLLVGFACGGGSWACLRRAGDAPAGLLAAALAILLVLVGIYFQASTKLNAAQAAAKSEAAYVQSIAEDIVWARAALPADPNSPPLESPLPPGAGQVIPADLLREAEATWAGMPEAEKQKIRSLREGLLASSVGEQSLAADLPSWLSRIVVALQAGTLALVVAAWPALAARYLGWAEN